MPTIAWWPHTSNRHVASARLRCFQVVQELARRGVDARLYSAAQRPPDTLVLSKRYDRSSIAHAATLRRDHGTRVVLDLCDNHFHVSDPDPRWHVRAEHLKAAVEAVDKVVASTEALRLCIEAACPAHPEVVVVGDAVEPADARAPLWQKGSLGAEYQLARFRAALARQPVAPGRRLLWFGNHGSGHAEGGMTDLGLIRQRLEQASAEQPLSLTVISNHKKRYRQLTHGWRLPTHYLDWHPRTFSRAAALHDIVVLPIGRNPFTWCKTNNRLATAFTHRLAAVADAIPSYEEFADSAVLNDWDAGLDRLMADAALRQACVERGLQRIEQRWSLAAVTGDWMRALDL